MDHTVKSPAHQLGAPHSHTLHRPAGSWFLGANASILRAERSMLPFPPCRSFSAVPCRPLSTCSVPLCTAAAASGLRESSQWGPWQEQGERKGRKAELWCGGSFVACHWPQLQSRDHSSQRPPAGPGNATSCPALPLPPGFAGVRRCIGIPSIVGSLPLSAQP